MQALLIVPGQNAPIELEVEKKHELTTLQNLVGGYIEVIPGFNTITYKNEKRKCVAYCNEEGKLQNLTQNIKATHLWVTSLRGSPFDVLVGPVVVVLK